MAAELEIVKSVQAGLAAQLDTQGIYDLVGDKIREVFDTQVVMISTFDLENEMAQVRYLIEKGERINLPPAPFGTAAKYFLDTPKTILLNTEQELKSFGMQIISGTSGVKSAIWIPMLVGGELRGTISLQNIDHEHAFDEFDVRLLETLSHSMSLALENVRLFEESKRLLKETEERNAELAVINSVQSGLAAQLDIQAIYDLVGNKIADIFPDAQSVGIGLFDPERKVRTWYYVIEKGVRYYPEPDRYAGKPYETLYDTTGYSREPVIYNENIHQILEQHGIPLVEGTEEPKSAVFVPMIVGDKIIGQIDLQNMEHEHAFSDSDIRLLSTLANSASIAIENARLFAETQRLLEVTAHRAVELATLNTVSQALVAEIDLDALIELTGEQMRTIFNADIVYIALWDRETNLINFPYNYGEEYTSIEYGQGLTSKILLSGEPLLINSDIGGRLTELGTKMMGRPASSYLGVPIISKGEAIGVISVQNTQAEGRFSEDHVRLLSTIAANVGTAIRNASLFDEIKRRKLYYEKIIAYSPAAIVLINRNADVTGWNPAAERLFGYRADEAIGRNLDTLIAKDEKLYQEAVAYSQQAIAENRLHVITRRTRKDSTMVDVEVMGLPVYVDGTHTGFIAIYHDISELLRARQEAIRANEAKSVFLANMSHELRTPLNAIIGFTRIVQRKGKDTLPQAQLDNLDKVQVSAEHLLSLINSVLDISKIEAGRMDVKLSSFQIKPLIEMALMTTQPLIRQDKVQVVSEIPPNLPAIYSDQEKLKQILLNLLGNSAKFTTKGMIKVSAKHLDSSIALVVRDSGIGISPSAMEQIFEEFQQGDSSTTRQYGGTGLGLSISRSLARLLGGELTAESEQGSGSTFTLTIPLKYEDPNQPQEELVADRTG